MVFLLLLCSRYHIRYVFNGGYFVCLFESYFFLSIDILYNLQFSLNPLLVSIICISRNKGIQRFGIVFG